MAELVTAFGLGLLGTVSPCFLPLYPGFLAYLAAQASDEERSSRTVQGLLGLVVLAGLMLSMLLLGGLIALLGMAVGQVLALVTPLATLLVVVLGVLLLLGVDIFKRLPAISTPGGGPAPLRAFLYGALYGPMLMPCAAPLLISVFTLSLTAVSVGDRLLYVLFFGLGLGLPLLVLSLLGQVRQRWLLQQMRRFYPVTGRIAGAVLVLVGAVELVRQWPFIRLYLGF